MPPQFGRNVKLVVKTAFIEYTLIKHYMSFDILLRRDSNPNTAKIEIYNLSESTRNSFKDESNFTSIEFYAGYGADEPPLIFSGSVANVWSIKSDKVNWRTTLNAGDGHREFDAAYFSKTYSKGVVLDTIFSDIAKALGLDIVSNVPEMLFVKTPRAVVLEGKAKDCMDRLARAHGLSWSVQFGALEITEMGQPPTQEQQAVVLGPNSGLIGSPTLTWSKKTKTKNSKPEFVSSVTVLANLNADIRPNRIIELKAQNTIVSYGQSSLEVVPSIDANGLYICDQVRYRGDTETGPYEVEVNADGR